MPSCVCCGEDSLLWWRHALLALHEGRPVESRNIFVPQVIFDGIRLFEGISVIFVESRKIPIKIKINRLIKMLLPFQYGYRSIRYSVLWYRALGCASCPYHKTLYRIERYPYRNGNNIYIFRHVTYKGQKRWKGAWDSATPRGVRGHAPPGENFANICPQWLNFTHMSTSY